MTPWISQSRPRIQVVYAGAAAAIGILLAGFSLLSHGPNAAAGALLGVLLVAIGVAGIAFTNRQRIGVDPDRRRIVIEDSRAFGSASRTISFDDIDRVGIGYLGKRSNHVEFYYVVLTLRSGEEYPLFAPGLGYEGASDRTTVEGWRDRIEAYLRA